MNPIKKSYHYYFTIIDLDNFVQTQFFEHAYFDYIFNYLETFPTYLQQGTCDILPQNSGVLFTYHVLRYFDPKSLMEDFKSCFAYYLPTDICDRSKGDTRKILLSNLISIT